jgi:hypothetical protein
LLQVNAQVLTAVRLAPRIGEAVSRQGNTVTVE